MGKYLGASLKWAYPNSWMISNRKSQRKGMIWGYPYDSGNLHVDIDPLLWMMADLGVDIILGHLQLPSFTQIHTCQAYSSTMNYDEHETRRHVLSCRGICTFFRACFSKELLLEKTQC